MITIALQGAEFFAYHGFYPEEQKLGCRFLVDIEVGFNPQTDPAADELKHTVDYEKVYNPRKLIETVGQAIMEKIQKKYPYVETICVTIKKLSPPLLGKVAHSAVTIRYGKQ
jgi:dihydroneopterin aldolase